jgi:hypothetical protein
VHLLIDDDEKQAKETGPQLIEFPIKFIGRNCDPVKPKMPLKAPLTLVLGSTNLQVIVELLFDEQLNTICVLPDIREAIYYYFLKLFVSRPFNRRETVKG